MVLCMDAHTSVGSSLCISWIWNMRSCGVSVSQLLTSVYCACVVAELHMESTASVLWKARCERWSCFPFVMMMFIHIVDLLIRHDNHIRVMHVQVHSHHAVCLSPTHVLLLAAKSAKTSMVPLYVRMQVNAIHTCTRNEQRIRDRISYICT